MFRNSKLAATVIKSLILLGLMTSCGVKESKVKELPIYGSREPIERFNENGEKETDTIYHTIGDFLFVDQDSTTITPDTFEDKIYVTDFFFTTCPSICPKMTAQMMRVYEQFTDNPQVKILSHTIDPAHDTVQVLKEYARNLGVSSDTWHFVTGKKEELFTMGKKNYMIAVLEDEKAEGGFFHGGHFLLIDANKHIRGIYDGTDSLDVNELLVDISILLNEINKKDNDLDKEI